MKSFLFKILILFSIVALVLTSIVWRFNYEYIDPLYMRLTTDKAPSLIIGTSRAAQGLLPQEFGELAPQIQNFSFTLLHSPFGPAYLKLIQKKLVTDSKSGLFIIAVDPWAVSSESEFEALPENFRENNSFTSQIHLVDVNPNFEYIFRYYGKPLYHVFAENPEDLKLHKNGWLEVNVPLDSATVQQRTQEKVKDYQKAASLGSLSPIRINALKETIEYLDKHGEVFLVRLPVSKEMAAIERSYAPDFDKMIQKIALAYNIQYLNYFNSSGEYLTTDGNHLSKEASKAISQKVVSDIKSSSKVAFEKR